MAEIDREKVIKGLKLCKQDAKLCFSETECPYQCEFPRYCLKLMADALELLKEQEWKLITEDSDGILHGLPGDDGQYLMTDGKDIWIDDYVDGADDGVWLDSGRDIREIKAWMYMPELPEQKGR